MAFPELGYDPTTISFMVQGFDQGAQFFKMLSGQMPDGFPKTLHYLALTAGMIGALMLIFNQKNHNFMTVGAWLFLVLVVIIAPIKNDLLFFEYRAEDLLGINKPESQTFTKDDQNLAYTPQLVVVHALSLVHRAINDALFDCEERANSLTKPNCKRRNPITGVMNSRNFGKMSSLSLGEYPASIVEVGMLRNACGMPTSRIAAAPYSSDVDSLMQPFVTNGRLKPDDVGKVMLRSGEMSKDPITVLPLAKMWTSGATPISYAPFAIYPMKRSGGTFVQDDDYRNKFAQTAGGDSVVDGPIASAHQIISDKVSSYDQGATFCNMSFASYGKLVRDFFDFFNGSSKPSVSCPVQRRGDIRVLEGGVKAGGDLLKLLQVPEVQRMPIKVGLVRREIGVVNGYYDLSMYDTSSSSGSSASVGDMHVQYMGERNLPVDRDIGLDTCSELHESTRERILKVVMGRTKVPSAETDILAKTPTASSDIIGIYEGDVCKNENLNNKPDLDIFCNQLNVALEQAAKKLGDGYDKNSPESQTLAHLYIQNWLLGAVVATNNNRIRGAIQAGNPEFSGMSEMESAEVVSALADNVIGPIASLGAWIGIKLKGIFAGAEVPAYLMILKVLVNMALLAVLLITPLIYLMGIMVPSYAPGVIILSIATVLVMRMLPITFTITDSILLLMQQSVEELTGTIDIEGSALLIGAATIYTSLFMITGFILFKVGDPQTAIEGLNKLEGVATDVASSAEGFAKVAAGLATAAVGTGVFGGAGAAAKYVAANREKGKNAETDSFVIGREATLHFLGGMGGQMVEPITKGLANVPGAGIMNEINPFTSWAEGKAGAAKTMAIEEQEARAGTKRSPWGIGAASRKIEMHNKRMETEAMNAAAGELVSAGLTSPARALQGAGNDTVSGQTEHFNTVMKENNWGAGLGGLNLHGLPIDAIMDAAKYAITRGQSTSHLSEEQKSEMVGKMVYEPTIAAHEEAREKYGKRLVTAGIRVDENETAFGGSSVSADHLLDIDKDGNISLKSDGVTAGVEQLVRMANGGSFDSDGNLVGGVTLKDAMTYEEGRGIAFMEKDKNGRSRILKNEAEIAEAMQRNPSNVELFQTTEDPVTKAEQLARSGGSSLDEGAIASAVASAVSNALGTGIAVNKVVSDGPQKEAVSGSGEMQMSQDALKQLGETIGDQVAKEQKPLVRAVEKAAEQMGNIADKFDNSQRKEKPGYRNKKIK